MYLSYWEGTYVVHPSLGLRPRGHYTVELSQGSVYITCVGLVSLTTLVKVFNVLFHGTLVIPCLERPGLKHSTASVKTTNFVV